MDRDSAMTTARDLTFEVIQLGDAAHCQAIVTTAGAGPTTYVTVTSTV